MELHNQTLKFNEAGHLLEKPNCPVCNNRKGWVYSDARQQFICGDCYVADEQKIQKARLEALQDAIRA